MSTTMTPRLSDRRPGWSTEGAPPPATRNGAPCASAATASIERLLAAAGEGDQRAWAELYLRFSTMMCAVARSCRLREQDAEDAAQTGWLRLLENVRRIQSPAALGAWLAITVRREALRLIRVAKREELIDPQLLPETPGSGLLLGRALAYEQHCALAVAMERLPDSQRVLLRVLVADPTPTYEQVAAALGIPVGSIGPTRGRALTRLRADSQLRRAIEDEPETARA